MVNPEGFHPSFIDNLESLFTQGIAFDADIDKNFKALKAGEKSASEVYSALSVPRIPAIAIRLCNYDSSPSAPQILTLERNKSGKLLFDIKVDAVNSLLGRLALTKGGDIGLKELYRQQFIDDDFVITRLPHRHFSNVIPVIIDSSPLDIPVV